jgi:CelD/BcsL family acetyltransferase involved in cellulose biosynthesis
MRRGTDAGRAARVERITSIEGFEAERARWEQVERADPCATVFTSWRWLRAYLPVARYRWTILVLREGGEAVAYLPIARGGSLFDRELYLGGNPVADYTGMVALPAREEIAIGAFADALLAERWDGFNVLDVNDERIDRLVRRLHERGLTLESTDETRCLSCALPDSWDAYVKDCISAKTRVNTVRVERRLAEALPDFRISEPTDADIDEHVEAMIAVNHKRWGGNLRNARLRYGRLFRNAYDAGVLRMFVYWDGTKPIAGATAFTDDLRSSFGLYMIGFDEAYDKLSPGKGIVGRAIRTAIQSGYKRFDFLRGDEPFKARYAQELHVTRHYRLSRPGLRSAAIARARPKWFALKIAVANVVYGPGRTI